MPRFSEPEVYLLDNWKDARLIEDAMKTVRSKYQETIDAVLEGVQKKHREFDCVKSYFPRNGSDGMAAVGKARWPKGAWEWPTGFYVENLQLENLTSSELEAPIKYVWIPESEVEPTLAEKSLCNAAQQLLCTEEFEHLTFESDSDGGWFWCKLEQSEEEFVDLLTKDDSRGFINCLVAHFEWMTKFTAVIDEVLLTAKRSRK